MPFLHHSTKATIIWHMICLVVGIVLASLAIFFTSYRFMHEGIESHVRSEMEVMRTVVENYLSQTRLRLAREATLLAEANDLKDALAGRDYSALRMFAMKAKSTANATFTTITDEYGIVLARGHSDKKGDEITQTLLMRKALAGESCVDFVRLKNNGLSVAAAIPVFVSGYQVGVLLFGEAFKTHTFVDTVKATTKLEMTIFDEDRRISTTIMEHGKRIIGTKLENKEIFNTVINDYKIFNGESTILNRKYETIYWPIKTDNNDVLGIFFLGTDVNNIEVIITRIAFSCLISTLVIAFALSVLGVHILRTLVNPLKRKAYIDGLTGINNRLGFKQSIADILTNKKAKGTFFLIDLDNFKIVNDSLGHPVGDDVLVHTAHTLNRVFRRGDIIARLGGDEFVVYAPTMEEKEIIIAKAQEFHARIKKKYTLSEGCDIIITASIGVAMYPDNGSNYEQLYRNADTALYEAKNTGKNKFVIFG